MTEAVDFQRMKQELIGLYERFLENPEDETAYREIVAYELEYGGLQVYNDYLKSQPVPTEIELALGGLSALYQYGMHEDTHEAYSDKKIVETAKRILAELKK